MDNVSSTSSAKVKCFSVKLIFLWILLQFSSSVTIPVLYGKIAQGSPHCRCGDFYKLQVSSKSLWVVVANKRPNKKLTLPSALQGESGRKSHIRKKIQNSFRKSGLYLCSRLESIPEVLEENTSVMVIPTDLRSNIFPFCEGKWWVCVCGGVFNINTNAKQCMGG